MAGHERRLERADRLARKTLTELGRELRQARLDHDLSQAASAAAVGMSQSSWGRIERGEALGVSLPDFARALAVVGLRLHVRAYPDGSALRDRAHLDLLERLRLCLGPGCRWRTEVVLPNPGDRRAWDALVSFARIRIGIEAETRARDAQELQRRLSAKRRDGGVDHVILLLSDTRHNRAFLRAAGPGFRADFPVDGRTALGCLADATDPGGSAIIMLRRPALADPRTPPDA